MCNSCNCFERIVKLIRSIQGTLNQHFKENAENCGLSTTEFMIMFEIYTNEGISLNELSKALDLPKSSVSRIVEQLVDKKIVNRIIPKENRRTVNLFINSEFINNQEVLNINKEFNDKLLKNSGDKEVNKIISALEDLKAIIK